MGGSCKLADSEVFQRGGTLTNIVCAGMTASDVTTVVGAVCILEVSLS